MGMVDELQDELELLRLENARLRRELKRHQQSGASFGNASGTTTPRPVLSRRGSASPSTLQGAGTLEAIMRTSHEYAAEEEPAHVLRRMNAQTPPASTSWTPERRPSLGLTGTASPAAGASAGASFRRRFHGLLLDACDTLAQVSEPRGPASSDAALSAEEAARALECLHARHSLLAELLPSDLAAASRLLHPVTFEPGEIVMRAGEAGDSCFIIDEGELDVLAGGTHGGPALATLRAGAVCGELSALHESVCPSTAVARSRVRAWQLRRSELSGSMRADAVLSRRALLQALRSAEVLSSLDDEALSKVADACEEVSFGAGETILEEGEVGSAMFLVRSGSVVVTRSSPADERRSYCGVVGEGGYFGERALLTRERRSATVQATVPTVCIVITRQAFEQLLGPLRGVLEQRIARDAAANAPRGGSDAEHGCPSLATATPAPRRALSAGVALAPPRRELVVIAALGAGTSGAVTLVEHPPSCRLFALKAVPKRRLARPSDLLRLVTERDVLLAARGHPCIAALHGTYQDERTAYLLLEPCLGGELFSLVRDNGHLDEQQARFYAAATALALARVHELQHVYRDLKAENVLIDAQGFPRLVDFGMARRLDRGERAYSAVGTLEYMAPEVIRRSGHAFAADWWSFGVLIFEMLVGRTPFLPPDSAQRGRGARRLDARAEGTHPDPVGLSEEADVMRLMKDILCARITWPTEDEPQLSADARGIIERLLSVNLAERLGNLERGMTDVMEHPWFEHFDFRSIMSRSAMPPYRPELESPVDTSCFEVDLADFAQKMRRDSAKDFSQGDAAELAKRDGRSDRGRQAASAGVDCGERLNDGDTVSANDDAATLSEGVGCLHIPDW